jgi:DNA-binding beta-propeller fold protein YncE
MRSLTSRALRAGRAPALRTLAVTCAVSISTVGLAVGASAASGPAQTPDKAVTMTHSQAAAMPKGDIPIDFDAPVAAGPRPALFTLSDNQGSWYDTGTEIVGTRSLAVAEMPTADPQDGLGAGVARVIGDGFLTGNKLLGVMNADMPHLTQDYAKGKTLGQMGVDIDKMLNLDLTRATARQILPKGDARIGQIDTLTRQLDVELANQPADKGYALNNSPSGAKLMDIIHGIRASMPLLPVTVNFNVGEPLTSQAHTASALIWPDGADGMPFDQAGAWKGSRTVQLTKPGLYAFGCKVHPYMLGAVVVDDPLTPGVDFGPKLRIKSRGMNVPSYDDIVYQLVNKFFVITNPANWQQFSATEDRTWNPSFAPAPILTADGSGPQLIPDLDSFMKTKFHLPKPLPKADMVPATPGVGQVWFDTQMEKYAGKDKSGAATELNAETWKIERKIAAPEIDMNNPHNMWTDKNEKYIYQTEWFGHMLDVFDRKTGALIRRIDVGPSPTHVMTRTDTDQLHVALGGGGAVMELAPGATKIDRRIAVGSPDEPIAHPHAHWMSGDAKWMATPNVNLYNASIVDIKKGTFRHDVTGEFPIATAMDPASTKTYMADFLGATVSCITLAPKGKACVGDDGQKVHGKLIDLWDNYDMAKGPSGGFGGLPIQIAVSPDDSGGLVANTLSSQLGVFDPKTDKVVGWLECGPGCHGVNFGAKKGGGYYAYVTSKFMNVLEVIDIDPNGDGNPADAAVVGRILTTADSATQVDDQVTDYAGMGGQGVMTVPLAYEGWVERVPHNAINNQLTCRQRNPLKFAKVCK